MKNEMNKEDIKKYLEECKDLSTGMNENISNIIKDLLSEQVKTEFNKIVNESLDEKDDEDYNVDEVEDTKDSEDANDAETSVDTTDTDMDSQYSDDNADNGEGEDTPDFGSEDETEPTDGAEAEDGADDGDEWSEFAKYKISDNEYDFSNANDDELIKVYKLLKDDDQIVKVDQEDDTVKLDVNGDEYLIDLNTGDNEEDANIEDEGMEKLGEGRIFEVSLTNEDLGYTDNYQSKTAMTVDSNKETSKSGRSWDKGVPTGTEKPFPHKPSKEAVAPFNIKEGDETAEDSTDAEGVEEGTNVGGVVQQNSTSKSHVPNSSGRDARNASIAGVHTKSTSQPRYESKQIANEEVQNIMRKANEIFKENKELKNALAKFRTVLQEAVVTNVNLGKIVKLFTENTTTKEEKSAIIKRFGSDAKTIEQSNALYESIKEELKKNQTNLVESVDKTDNKNKISEQKIYQSKDLMESLSLMNKICKL